MQCWTFVCCFPCSSEMCNVTGMSFWCCISRKIIKSFMFMDTEHKHKSERHVTCWYCRHWSYLNLLCPKFCHILYLSLIIMSQDTIQTDRQHELKMMFCFWASHVGRNNNHTIWTHQTAQLQTPLVILRDTLDLQQETISCCLQVIILREFTQKVLTWDFCLDFTQKFNKIVHSICLPLAILKLDLSLCAWHSCPCRIPLG